MEVQKALEGQKYVTISLVPYAISEVRKYLVNFIATCTLVPVRALAQLMLTKFTTNFGTGADHTVFTENDTRGHRQRQKGLPRKVLLSAALDPRIKPLHGIYPGDQERIWEKVLLQMREAAGQPDPAPMVEEINVAPVVLDFFGGLAAPPIVPVVVEDDDLIRQELTRYRAAEPMVPRENDQWNDPLVWWRVNHHTYPNLAKLARKYLCIPATSAPSERVFSQAGLTIANARARLLPDHAEDLIFLHGALAEAENFVNVFDV
jgi:hypothetical protein